MTSAQQLLDAVETAITEILSGAQAYQVGERMYRFADLGELRTWRKELQAEVARSRTGGARVRLARFAR